MRNKTFVFILVLLFFSKNSLSQPDYYSIWLDYNHSNTLKKDWFIESDYGYRFRLKYGSNWQRLHVRTGFGYKHKKVKLLAGAALFLVYLPNEISDLEIRPWQGAKFTWPSRNRFRVKHFTRLEERIHFLGTSTGKAYNYFELKFRYSMMFEYAIIPKDLGFGVWVVMAGLEPFFNIYTNKTPIAVTKSRTTIGLLFDLNNKTKFRISYIYQPNKIPIIQDQEIYSNLFRFSIIQKFR